MLRILHKCFHHRDTFNYSKDLTFDFGFLENDCNQCTHKAFMSPQHKSLIRKVFVSEKEEGLKIWGAQHLLNVI